MKPTCLLLSLVSLAMLHAQSPSVFVPPPVASQARWERQMLHYGELHLKQMEKAIADPKADATIGANFYDRVRLLYGMADYTRDDKWAKAAAALAHLSSLV
jgi:hypothetical protein